MKKILWVIFFCLPISQVASYHQKECDARHMLCTSRQWIWVNKIILCDDQERVKKIQLVTPYKQNAQLLLSIYSGARGKLCNVDLFVQFQDWKDVCTIKGPDGLHYAYIEGRFDTRPRFHLSMPANDTPQCICHGVR